MIGRCMVLFWMPIAFAAASVHAEAPQASSKPAVGQKSEQRSLTAIQKDVRAALAAEAKTRRTRDNTPEVLRLVELYREMAAHSRRDKSAMLKELGQQVRSRLVTVRDRINTRIAHSNKANKNQKAPPAAGQDARVLAQQVPPPNPGVAREGAAQGLMVTGIPRATGLPTDLGPELVELIQATISPATWNINGGRGAVVYYTPLHVLVVAAPQEVQEQVAGAVQQLHAAQQQIDGTQIVSGVDAVGLNEQAQ